MFVPCPVFQSRERQKQVRGKKRESANPVESFAQGTVQLERARTEVNNREKERAFQGNALATAGAPGGFGPLAQQPGRSKHGSQGGLRPVAQQGPADPGGEGPK